MLGPDAELAAAILFGVTAVTAAVAVPIAICTVNGNKTRLKRDLARIELERETLEGRHALEEKVLKDRREKAQQEAEVNAASALLVRPRAASSKTRMGQRPSAPIAGTSYALLRLGSKKALARLPRK